MAVCLQDNGERTIEPIIAEIQKEAESCIEFSITEDHRRKLSNSFYYNSLNNLERKMAGWRTYQSYLKGSLTECRDFSIQLKQYFYNELPEFVFEWAIDLMGRSVKNYYEQSSDGWDEDSKRSEMSEQKARYLVVTRSDTKQLVAFSHYRIDKDFGRKIVYCYEVHVEPSYRGNGIGKYILDHLWKQKELFNLSGVVLTCFKANTKAIKFYRKNKYTLDETSPKDTEHDICDYTILSRMDKPKRRNKMRR